MRALIALAVILLVCLCLPYLHPAHAEAPAAIRQWEYAWYVHYPLADVWVEPSRQLSAPTVNDVADLRSLYRQMGGNKDANQIDVNNILNLAGASGWELVTVTYQGKIDNYVFKRPK